MRPQAWRWLLLGGLVGGSVALSSGCSSGADDASGSGNKTSSGATGGSTGGTGAAGKGGTGGTGGTTGGTGGSSATGGTGGSGGTGGTTGGSAGAAAGSTASGGAPAGGMAGSLGSGGAAAGNGGGGMPATLVTPIKRSDSSYVLEFGDTYFEVNPTLGARVVDVHLKGGMNLLGAGKDADNKGSTFWPSPQAAWTWPPTDSASITNINDKPYTGTTDASSMTLVGQAASSVGISVTKKFAADLAKEAVVATYTMIGTAAGKSAAPWEITRFPQTGVTFFPSGGTTTTAKNTANNMDPPTTTTAADCTWLSSPGSFASPTAKDQLLVVNGTSNWLAHADSNWVVVKKFTHTPASMIATGEGEICIYMNNPGTSAMPSGNPTPYMEVEEQGPYGAVGQGMMVDWTVTWFVRKLPDGAMAVAGNQALVDFVKSLVQ